MLQWANTLAAETFQVTATDPVTGELTYKTDASGNPVCVASGVTCTTFTNKLNGLNGNISTVRQLTLSLGTGVWGHCDANHQVGCQ
jgi:hypothetical protein